MARIRLTNKNRIANDPADMEGNRQDCGKKTRFQKYHKFDPAKDDVGGRGNKSTDGSKLYEGDKALRNDMHVTELRQAKLWERSKLATKLAMYLLGEKAPQSMIKAQAAEFLTLGNSKLAKAVSRFAKTQYLYSDEEQDQQGKKACGICSDEEQDQQGKKACGDKCSEQEQDQQGKKADQDDKETTSDDKPQAQGESQDQGKSQDQGEGQAVVQTEGQTEGQGEGQAVEKTQGQEDGVVQQEEKKEQQDDDQIDEATLASLFEGNGNAIVANKKEAKSVSKVGVQKFEQPQKNRVASNKVSLDQLWAGAPDLSKIFN